MRFTCLCLSSCLWLIGTMGREWPGGQEGGIRLAQIHAPGVAVRLTSMLHFPLLEAEVLVAYQ